MVIKSIIDRVTIHWPLLAVGFVLGFLSLFAWHVATASTDSVHYHANFHLYIDGERYEFDNFTYYEEVQACDPVNGVRPESRAHMHDFVDHVVHVHDEGATWGHFFANLGYALGNDVLATRDGVFMDDGESQLRFMLNGESTRSIANILIQDKDLLLVDYGSDDLDKLEQRYENIPNNAHQYNQKDDPSACAGEGELTPADRVRSVFNL